MQWLSLILNAEEILDPCCMCRTLASRAGLFTSIVSKPQYLIYAVLISPIFKPGLHPQPAFGALTWFTEIVFVKVCVCVCVCVCVRTYLSIYLPTYVCPYAPTWEKLLNNGKSSLYVRSKSEMKSVLNFCTGELCSEVVSFRRTEIRVWQLSSDFANYLPFEVFRRLTTEKQWCRPRTLPGIAYRFELKGGVSLTYANKNEEQLWGFVERICGEKCDSQTIKQFRRYFCA